MAISQVRHKKRKVNNMAIGVEDKTNPASAAGKVKSAIKKLGETKIGVKDNTNPKSMAGRVKEAISGESKLSKNISAAAKAKKDTTSRISPSDKVGPKMDRGTTPKKAAAKAPEKKAEAKPKAAGKTSAFGKAFAESRKSGAKEFTFGGKKYNTKVKGEK
jgi:hypothetical protein